MEEVAIVSAKPIVATSLAIFRDLRDEVRRVKPVGGLKAATYEIMRREMKIFILRKSDSCFCRGLFDCDQLITHFVVLPQDLKSSRR